MLVHVDFFFFACCFGAFSAYRFFVRAWLWVVGNCVRLHPDVFQILGHRDLVWWLFSLSPLFGEVEYGVDQKECVFICSHVEGQM